MTNEDKRELRWMCKHGWSFEDIKGCVTCADSTIKKYLKIFGKGSRHYIGKEQK